MAPLDWKAYYELEALISDFDPESDGSEIHRCRAGWSVFPRRSPSSVLDVGCGDGFFCHWIRFRTSVARCVGVDVSQRRLNRALKRYPAVSFVRGDVLRLPFGDAEFDVVTCIEVLEHMADPGAVLRELRRVARSHVVVTVPDRQPLRDVLCPHCLQAFPLDGHLHSFDAPGLTELGQTAGLEVGRVRSYHLPATGGLLPRWVGTALRWAQTRLRPGQGLFLAVCFRVGSSSPRGG